MHSVVDAYVINTLRVFLRFENADLRRDMQLVQSFENNSANEKADAVASSLGSNKIGQTGAPRVDRLQNIDRHMYRRDIFLRPDIRSGRFLRCIFTAGLTVT